LRRGGEGRQGVERRKGKWERKKRRGRGKGRKGRGNVYRPLAKIPAGVHLCSD